MGLDKIVFEIVQVVKDGLAVKTRGGVGLGIVKPFVSGDLKIGQIMQHHFVKFGDRPVPSIGGEGALHMAEQRVVAEVVL